MRMPSPACVHNYLLRGHDHARVDRKVAAVMLAADPRARLTARLAHRHRAAAMTYLAEEHGIRQVLVVGCGYPMRPYVHQVVGRHGPAHVVYADPDPVALARSRAAMNARPPSRTGFILADLAQPASLTGVLARDTLDFNRPVAVLLHHVLHLMPDPSPLLARLTAMLPSGSALSITHPTGDLHPRHKAAAQAATAAGMPTWLRTQAEVEQLCAGWRLVRGGVQPVASWGRGHGASPVSAESCGAYAALALKP
ncbi:SAM-dependent methyltransferase [Streptomyces mobaraensis]|nr:SAM-dependent methyltransferase [Streptomyces mobaraensis]